jgi:hypothetical protein
MAEMAGEKQRRRKTCLSKRQKFCIERHGWNVWASQMGEQAGG